MAANSVYDFLALINQQVDNREQISASLSKAEALIVVAIQGEVVENLAVIVYEYLWVLNDLIEQALKLNEDSLSVLLQMRKI